MANDELVRFTLKRYASCKSYRERRSAMQLDGLFNTTVELVGKSIDLRAKNQNLIASNIANAETPNYVPKALDFEEELQGVLKGGAKGTPAMTNARHLPLK